MTVRLSPRSTLFPYTTLFRSLVLGDTNSCLSAIAAKRRRIPVFHMEAGNRCFDERVPEEINRRIIDHIADVNLPYSDIARDRKSTRLNSSHLVISYAVFCLTK